MSKKSYNVFDWKDADIDNYIKTHSVLILYKIHIFSGEAELIMYGDLNEKQKLLLKVCIVGEFGGKNISGDMFGKINEYAEKWYDDFIKQSKIRVLNFKKRGSRNG